MYEYKAEVLRIVDGDTFDMDVDLGFEVHIHPRIRLASVDVFETYGVKKDSEEYKKGAAAVDFIKSLMPVGSTVKLKTYKMKTSDKERKGARGRWLADVLFEQEGSTGNWFNLALVLLTNGHVKAQYPMP